MSTQEKVADLLLWKDPTTKLVLEQTAKKYGVSLDALAELIDWQREQAGKLKTRDRNVTFDEIFGNNNYWKKG